MDETTSVLRRRGPRARSPEMTFSANELTRVARGCVAGALIGFAVVLCADALAQSEKALEEIQKYRQMLEEGNPADLAEQSGRELWSARRGPKQASLEQCDLGLGPGRVDGAYAQLPRYFADTGKVQDVESRLVTCMMTLQGFSLEEATRGWYKRDSDIEALVTYVAAQSKGSTIDVPASASCRSDDVRGRAGDLLAARRSAGFLLCHLPLPRRAPHPPAGSAQLHRSARRTRRRW